MTTSDDAELELLNRVAGLINQELPPGEIRSQLDDEWDALAQAAMLLVVVGRLDDAITLIEMGAPVGDCMPLVQVRYPERVRDFWDAETLYFVLRYQANPEQWELERAQNREALLAAKIGERYIDGYLDAMGYGVGVKELAGIGNFRG